MKLGLIALSLVVGLVWTGIARADEVKVGPHGTHDAVSAAFVAKVGYPELICPAPLGPKGELVSGGIARCYVVYVRK